MTKLEIRKLVINQLKTVFDPELPINIWDLGLVHGVEIAGENDFVCNIMMTFTSPNCPSCEDIISDIKTKVQLAFSFSRIDVEVVWNPPWDKSLLSDEMLLEIGLY
jgi:metal-sulfur cluster biosynthetic enzyme